MSESRGQKGRIALVATCALHVLAVATIALGSMLWFANPASWKVLSWSLRHGQFVDVVLGDVAIHFGLCVLVWAALAFCYTRLRKLVDAVGDGGRTRVKLTARRGTVLTETLIVLPVALLLIMGIAQMALVNIATTLSDLAVIQATRSVWVWAPEAQEGRFNVDRTLVSEKARVQAAAIMAPTASSDFGGFNTSSNPDYSGTFRKAMGAMYGTQLETASSDVGSYASTEAELRLSPGEAPTTANMAFNQAFDSDDFGDRTARKFFNAWSQTEIEIVETPEWIGAKMKYEHLCLMPLVAGIFGEYKHVNGQDGYFLTINRAFSLPKQVKPNANLPRR